MDTPDAQYDVVIIGGALSGASTAICLLQENPDLRVLIVERSEAFKRRVGEATVEISGYFLTRVLGLTHHLNHQHLVKQGFRFWFHRDEKTPFERCTEVGAKYLARVPAFQIDRSVLDQEILNRAEAAGAVLWRPAQVTSVEPRVGGPQTLTLRKNDQSHNVEARWVVDASGVSAMLSRQMGWWRRNTQHPTTAVWARWEGVRDWDDPDLARDHPQWTEGMHGMRNTATNHLMGDGWWAWWIPLRSGHVSIGVVYDHRLFQWPTTGSLADQLRSVLASHPVGRKMLGEGRCVEDDVHLRKNLSYDASAYAQDGLALVGDAAAFLDPFYSPGLDWVSFSVYATCRMIGRERRGESVGPLVAEHNRTLSRAYRRWFEAIYLDKYELMGDAQLSRLAFELDLGLYYVGVVSQPYKRGPEALAEAVFTVPISTPVFHLMRLYNRRLVRMAKARRGRGAYGHGNTDRRHMMDGYTFSPGSSLRIATHLLRWLGLELCEGWRSWFGRGHRRPDKTQAVPSGVDVASEVTPAGVPSAPADVS